MRQEDDTHLGDELGPPITIKAGTSLRTIEEEVVGVLGVEMEGSVPGTPPQVRSLCSSTDNSQTSSITLFDVSISKPTKNPISCHCWVLPCSS